MKYILKRDLPFAKAGTEVRYFYGTSLDHINYNDETETVDIHFKREESIKILIGDWIEEVKSRERWILSDKRGELIFNTLEEAERVLNRTSGFLMVDIQSAEIYKLKEVL